MWDKAKYFNFDFGKGIVFPLKYQKNYYTSLMNKNNTSNFPKASMNISDLDYLLIYKNDNQFTEQLVKIIPEEDYLIKSNFRNRKISFSGYIIISDWKGNFQKGYYYEKGKIVGNVVNSKSGRAKVLSCDRVDYFMCPSENLAPSGEIINFSGCDFMFSDYNCYQLPSGGNGGGEGGEGGQQYSEAPISYDLSAEKPVFPSEERLKQKLCVTTRAEFHAIKDAMIDDWKDEMKAVGLIDKNPDIGYDQYTNSLIFRGVSTQTRTKSFNTNYDFDHYSNCH